MFGRYRRPRPHIAMSDLRARSGLRRGWERTGGIMQRGAAFQHFHPNAAFGVHHARG